MPPVHCQIEPYRTIGALAASADSLTIGEGDTTLARSRFYQLKWPIGSNLHAKNRQLTREYNTYRSQWFSLLEPAFLSLKLTAIKKINRIFHPQVCQATKYSDNPQLVKWSADRFPKNKKEMERAKIEEQESESHEPDAVSFAPFFFAVAPSWAQQSPSLPRGFPPRIWKNQFALFQWTWSSIFILQRNLFFYFQRKKK